MTQPILKRIYRRIRSIPFTQKERRHSLVGPPHLWKMKREFQIEFLQEQGLEPSHFLLDIGCGTLRGGLPLIAYLDPGHYTGLEVDHHRLQEGRRELQEAGLENRNPTLLTVLSYPDLRLDKKFDLIWAFSVLMHLSDKILEDVLAFASRHLSDGGQFFANVNLAERAEGSWQEFPVVARSEEFYRAAGQEAGLSMKVLGQLQDMGHQSGDSLSDQQYMIRLEKS